MAAGAILRQGKLIRPGILLLITGHFGYRGSHDLPLAAAVEGLHLASLIHDDIIDRSAYRRGEKTAWQRFGSDFSLLLGDFFFIRSVARSLALEEKEIPAMLAEAARLMIEGEIEELAESHNIKISRARYLKIIEKKTASLFQTTCRLAARLGGAGSEETKALEEYGLNLGLTFQVIDDLLDLTGRPSQTGKPAFSDLREGRVTLPLIYALRAAGPAEQRQMKKELERIKTEKTQPVNQKLINFIRSTEALQKTFRQAEVLAARARSAVLRLRPSLHRRSLLQLTDFVLWREQ
ncbi:MAG: polyprenyl synthetase family protein [Candidatus Saccharicenans sp.]|nr:polyprenyl synthetase family protein [Candidatus Saccharicenans sp.]